MTPHELTKIAHQVCTPKELDALARHLAGDTDTTISIALGISRQAVHSRLTSAIRKITAQTTQPTEAA